MPTRHRADPFGKPSQEPESAPLPVPGFVTSVEQFRDTMPGRHEHAPQAPARTSAATNGSASATRNPGALKSLGTPNRSGW